jgi:AraC-like DNA-binding protein/ligand-binding sensor protein
MIKTSNVIQRRDLDPLLLKAREVIRYYEKAANCIVSVLGPDCTSIEDSKHPKAILFCALCKQYHQNTGKDLAPNEYPCTGLHCKAIQEARRLGGSYVYMCPAGFVFWTSPLYSGERFAGALMSSGFLAIERRQAVENIFQLCGGAVSHADIEQYLEGIPEKNGEEIKALAQMMLICADQISAYNDENEQMPLLSPVQQIKIPQNGESALAMEQERRLLASLRRGDAEDTRKLLKELVHILYEASGGNFDYFKLRIIELVVFLSREAANPGNAEHMKDIETNSRYLKRIEDAQNIEEVSENLFVVIERMSGKIFSFQGVRHASALRKAERFIWDNYTRKISLQEVAQVSGLSAPYFSTVFKDEMGENLSNYLNRLRVEKAAAMLRETELSINEIAAACGFEDQSWFSKIFKNHTGFSPGKYREHGGNLPLRNTPALAAELN